MKYWYCICHVYDPDGVDNQLTHDESVGKYVMMNRVKPLLDAYVSCVMYNQV